MMAQTSVSDMRPRLPDSSQPAKPQVNQVWHHAGTSAAARRIYDIRLVVTLRHFRVTHFATANAKHFQGFGFDRVWNPLAS